MDYRLKAYFYHFKSCIRLLCILRRVSKYNKVYYNKNCKIKIHNNLNYIIYYFNFFIKGKHRLIEL